MSLPYYCINFDNGTEAVVPRYVDPLEYISAVESVSRIVAERWNGLPVLRLSDVPPDWREVVKKDGVPQYLCIADDGGSRRPFEASAEP